MSETGVVVVTHGEAAQSMVEAAERVVGSLRVATVSVPIGEPPQDTERKLEVAVERLQGDQVLFLIDLEGSTPYRLCCHRCGGHSVVLSGMNLPMLFKLATADRTRGAMALASELRATGLKSIHIHSGAR